MTVDTKLTSGEAGLARGIALMAFTKIVLMGWLDMGWAWPLTWLAFSMMLPWFVETLTDNDKGAK